MEIYNYPCELTFVAAVGDVCFDGDQRRMLQEVSRQPQGMFSHWLADRLLGNRGRSAELAHELVPAMNLLRTYDSYDMSRLRHQICDALRRCQGPA
jgi:hypothetical protein